MSYKINYLNKRSNMKFKMQDFAGQVTKMQGKMHIFFGKFLKSCINFWSAAVREMQNFEVAQKWNVERAKTKVALETALE